ncbi:MAG: sigma-70 family RNA polymerase sigma factor [Gemmatales bacterium]
MQAYGPLLQLVRQFHGSHRDEMTDGELLRQFLAEPEQTTFATLVQRHGTMVFHVCRRVLGCSHDVEDAFQATFLVLVQKARQLQHRETVGDWLHGVAHHTALKARAMISKRTNKERRAVKPVEVMPTLELEPWQQILDEEVRRLPATYRKAFVLCDLQQKTRKEAAKALGWQEGTVASRLARGRSLLCQRLKKRGIEVTVAMLGVELAQASAMPLSLMHAVTQAACQLASGVTVISAASVHVATLMKAGLASTITHKASLIVAGFALAVGVVGWNWAGTIDRPMQAMTNISQAPVQEAPKVSETVASAEPPRRLKVSPPARNDGMAVAQKLPAVKQRNSQGSDEEILSQMGLTDEQLLDFLMIRQIMSEQSQEMYKMPTGKRERGLEINQEWNAGLREILTIEQYLQYCEYWDSRTFRAAK